MSAEIVSQQAVVSTEKPFDLKKLLFLASIIFFPVILIIWGKTPDNPASPRNDLLFLILALPPAIVIAATLISNFQQKQRVDFVRALPPEKYVPKIIDYLHSLARYNPELYGGRMRYLGHEGKPEDADGGSIPREVDFLFAGFSDLTGGFTNIIRVRMSAEHDFYVVGTQSDYVGNNTRLFNRMGMRRITTAVPVDKSYTKVIREKAGPTKETSVEEPEETEGEEAETEE